MFYFKEKTLNPAIRSVVGKIDETLKIENPVEKIGKLLSIKQETNQNFRAIAARGIYYDNVVYGITITAAVSLAAALVFFSPPLLGAAGAWIVGAVVLGTGVLIGLTRSIDHKVQTIKARDILERKIERDLAGVLKAASQDAAQSAKIMTSWKGLFNTAASSEEKYTQLKLSVGVASQPASTTSLQSGA